MLRAKEIWTNIEIRFWQEVAIPALSSDSEFLRKIVKAVLFTRERYKPMKNTFKLFFWICIGLVFGLALGYILA